MISILGSAALLLLVVTFLLVALSPLFARGALSYSVFIILGIAITGIVYLGKGNLLNSDFSDTITACLVFWNFAMPFYVFACMLKGTILMTRASGAHNAAIVYMFVFGNAVFLSTIFGPPIIKSLISG